MTHIKSNPKIWSRFYEFQRKTGVPGVDQNITASTPYMPLGKRKTKRQRKKPGRQSRYNNERILTPLKAIWLVSDLVCSKKLKVALRDWLPPYEKEHGGWMI